MIHINKSKKKANQRHFRSDIEGLRAIAILLVVGYHAKVPGLDGGYVGVDVFFVLSGYLITLLLVQEAENTGTIDLIRFYARRARRLLPALALVLLVTIPLSAIIYAPLEQHAIANTAISTAAYLSNVFFTVISTNYLGGSAENNPLLHTWSLSVEEQFYMVWPIFVMLALGALKWQPGGINRRRLLGWLVLVAVASFVSSCYLTSIRQPWAFFLCPTRAWEFAIGAIGVLAPPGWWFEVFSGMLITKKHSLSIAGFIEDHSNLIGWVGLVGVLLAAVTYDHSTVFPGWAALLPALSTVMVLRAGNRTPSSITKALSLRPLQEIGRLSYSWYLWHWPVLVIVGTIVPELSLPTRVSLLIVSLAFAEVSYRLVENPIRHNVFLAKRSVNSLAMAAVITIFCVGFSFGWKKMSIGWKETPEQTRFVNAKNDASWMQTSGCNSDYYSSDLNLDNCIAGDLDAPRKMVLFGDSHALQWSPALEEIAVQNEWQLIVLTKDACASVDVPYYYSAVGREYKECAVWRDKVLGRIEELSPELVVISNSYFYPFDKSEWANGFNAVIRSISKSSQYVAIIRDTPRFKFDVPSHLARKAWNPVDVSQLTSEYSEMVVPPQVDVWEVHRQISAKYHNVFELDMNPYICQGSSCELEQNGIIIFKDSNHLSASFSKSLAPVIGETLKQVITGNYVHSLPSTRNLNDLPEVATKSP